MEKVWEYNKDGILNLYDVQEVVRNLEEVHLLMHGQKLLILNYGPREIQTGNTYRENEPLTIVSPYR